MFVLTCDNIVIKIHQYFEILHTILQKIMLYSFTTQLHYNPALSNLYGLSNSIYIVYTCTYISVYNMLYLHSTKVHK